MEVTLHSHDGLVVIALRGSVDGTGTTELERQCASALERGASRLVFDLGELESISSSGVDSILAATLRLKQSGGRAAVCSPPIAVAERFATAAAEHSFAVVGGLAAAMRTLR